MSGLSDPIYGPMLGIMESMHEFVLTHLRMTKGNWPAVARESGVPYRTLKKIATQDIASPGIVVMEKLAGYFRERATGQHHSA